MNNNNLKLQSFLKESIDDNLKILEKKEFILNSLLNSKSYKYKDAYFQSKRAKFFNLNNSDYGIYHFYYIQNSIKYSLYVGKASLGKNGGWNLSKRLNQHFQSTQQNTIHGKINKKLDLFNNDIAIQFLCNEDIYLQFFKISPQTINYSQINYEVKLYENFCINTLKPIFTDK